MTDCLPDDDDDGDDDAWTNLSHLLSLYASPSQIKTTQTKIDDSWEEYLYPLVVVMSCIINIEPLLAPWSKATHKEARGRFSCRDILWRGGLRSSSSKSNCRHGWVTSPLESRSFAQSSSFASSFKWTSVRWLFWKSCLKLISPYQYVINTPPSFVPRGRRGFS